MKRLFDIVFSFIAIAVFALPALVISSVLACIEKHPVLFKQERLGRHKRMFKILKFQTMVNNVPTRTGRLLRQTGLDEIPQFLNVLKGDMSIVGPRALTLFDICRLGWYDSYHEIRWELKPGITGFAQLYGGQHRKTSWFWDKRYIQNHNILIDMGVIAISFLMNMFGKTRIRKIVFQKITQT